MKCKTEDPCFYCEQELATQHEHDHFPIPKRFGGKQTVCACINCHSRKDRMPLDTWRTGVAINSGMGLWKKANANERILLAKMFNIVLDSIELMDKKAS